MPEIEHAELLQAANLIGHFGQFVVGKHQRFEIGLFIYRVRRSPVASSTDSDAMLRNPARTDNIALNLGNDYGRSLADNDSHFGTPPATAQHGARLLYRISPPAPPHPNLLASLANATPQPSPPA